jgi:RNA polymerase sigma-70 factor (ECF subfamily)
MKDLTEGQVAELLECIAAGDEQSLCVLYRAYGRRVYAFALNTLRDAHDAEQVVVDTMFEVWRQAERFNRTCRFTTWLLGIARNKALHALRARAPAHDGLEAIQERLASKDADPYHALLERQRWERLLLSLDDLPQPQRECLRLAVHDGLSLAEIARIQACPENTVKTRLFKARRKLRARLARFLDGDGAWLTEREAARDDLMSVEPDRRWAGATVYVPEAAAA